ncbi:imidazole glycerol phosphate synthase cyclase subunit [Sulfodiicoccus acidiphilus]|uniref:Imidazole glycerol phosphate synthase subunit HisF n=1 Tax=Sulfodiicoccus acidiphilus TaxID=1670455 RepID=A0A348B730_9CREN|nr:imidazole glycerol phosphate synthase subunit HisF [Sulfodiicoccus acidiphilus]BBD73982.1 imidazole glycerol phosphate synthase cyclase subunit [Sulfodiicoccus acidiphilus]GGU02665.1 imidazole glycerol phosphate synthase cyclase subunit [Sulfodiicoccus acidiphilus]
MTTKRIIPCLDVKWGRVVKGVKFLNLRDEGDPAELASRYEEEGADELVFLDVTATVEGRGTLLESVKSAASVVSIPLTVGGGVRSVQDASSLFSAGADKVSLNTAAVENPNLVTQIAREFGSQAVVVAIDAKRSSSGWKVHVKSGSVATELDVVWWGTKVVQLGAGEILLTSIDRDGTREGYDVELTRAVTSSVNVPVIASGGAGKPEHILQVLTEGGADAALAAGMFHDGVTTVSAVKRFLLSYGVEVRP